MGRKIRTDVPQLTSNFIPMWEHIQDFRRLDTNYRQVQKENYDRRHGVKTLLSLPENTTVWVDNQGHQVPGRILRTAGTPQSYIVEAPSGELQRNWAHIRVRTDMQGTTEASHTTEGAQTTTFLRPITRSQTGSALHHPNRLQYGHKT